jgi:hypothetical protein
MPLAKFIAATIAEFRKATPQEIKMKRLSFLRDAEAEGRFEQTFEILNWTHRFF